MPLTCQRNDCNGAVALRDADGNLEHYDCEYGHAFSVLVGRR